MMKNQMEKLVADCLSRTLEERAEEVDQICHCPVCLAEMQVNALNRLAPLYTAEDALPDEYFKREEEYRLELFAAVGQAIEQIGRTAHKNNGQLGAKDMQSLAGLHKRNLPKMMHGL